VFKLAKGELTLPRSKKELTEAQRGPEAGSGQDESGLAHRSRSPM
jgi:hypothetical protein